MSNGLNNLRRKIQPSFGPAAHSAPLFRPPSHAEVVETVVSEVIGGRAIVAVRGDAGVGKTALAHLAASMLRSHGRTVASTNAGSVNPGTLLQLLGQALRIDGADRLAPNALLERFQTWTGPEQLVLIIDDAHLFSSAMFRTLALLMKLFSLRPTALQVVLVGRLGQWRGVQPPDLEAMRRATLSLHTIAAAPPGRDTGVTERDVELGSPTRPVPAEAMRQALSRRSHNRVVIAVLGLLMTGVATAELIELSDAVGPSRDATHVSGQQISVPPPPADSAAETAAGALPVMPSPEAATPPPAVAPPPAPPPETRTVQETAPAPQEVQAESTESMLGSHGGPGLVLVAGAGDNLPTLYAKVYRGVRPPPYVQVVAANRMPVKPGALVVFPEPPTGWPLR